MGSEHGTAATDVAVLLRRWVDGGLITAEQAERIRAAEGLDGTDGATDTDGIDDTHDTHDTHGADGIGEPTAPPRSDPGPQPQRGSLVAEGLGYVGGALVLVAAVVISGTFWDVLGPAGRLGLVLVAAALLLGVGAAAPAGRPGSATGSDTGGADDSGRRLRAVSWLLGEVAAAGALGLLAGEVIGLPDGWTPLVAAGGAAALAALLWARSATPAQHAGFVVAAVITAGCAAALLPDGDEHAVGIAVWGAGVVWLLLGWGAVVGDRVSADVCGGAAAGVGALLTVDTTAGSALAVLTAAVLVVAGVLARDLVLLGVGSVVTLVTVPLVMGRWFPDVLSAALALLVAGALLVLVGLRTARRRTGRPGGPSGPATAAPRTAIGAAAAVALAVLVAVLVVGLA
ncbi:hypothetical protein [Pseudonocardia humida]|uniref:Membrane protein DUF2157 n=1 Tax=Pseudonocardia humida TaxID=2800819 RepID=A0ABT1AC46_9PSEU|nr:hypothetical protein [Pseudonocardia humida]MCO1660374.1 hypothetical protein [Pseudonocardia humida]